MGDSDLRSVEQGSQGARSRQWLLQRRYRCVGGVVLAGWSCVLPAALFGTQLSCSGQMVSGAQNALSAVKMQEQFVKNGFSESL